jgi:hypothetical protein
VNPGRMRKVALAVAVFVEAALGFDEGVETVLIADEIQPGIEVARLGSAVVERVAASEHEGASGE